MNLNVGMTHVLQFEWAWQHPKKSRRLQHLPGKRSSEKKFQFCFRIACEMLRIGPWNRLPLTVRWLKQEYALDFPAELEPPSHMPVAYGPVISKKVQHSKLLTGKQNLFHYLVHPILLLACLIILVIIETRVSRDRYKLNENKERLSKIY